uniref:Uncharacterized protein n=1 Tax=Arundo donax TaxID=35708 RepID=A0A0A9HHC0_ARUDO
MCRLKIYKRTAHKTTYVV